MPPPSHKYLISACGGNNYQSATLCYAREGPVGSRAQDNSRAMLESWDFGHAGMAPSILWGFVLRAPFFFVLIRIFDLAFKVPSLR